MQDEGLQVISEGLDTLKNLARDMNEVCSDHSFSTFYSINSLVRRLVSFRFLNFLYPGIGSAGPLD